MKKILFTLLLTLSSYSLNASERIVSLAPSINEIVFALGLGDEVVANTMFCNYPEQSKSKLKIGGYSSISIETLLKFLSPDILIKISHANRDTPRPIKTHETSFFIEKE